MILDKIAKMLVSPEEADSWDYRNEQRKLAKNLFGVEETGFINKLCGINRESSKLLTVEQIAAVLLGHGLLKTQGEALGKSSEIITDGLGPEFKFIRYVRTDGRVLGYKLQYFDIFKYDSSSQIPKEVVV